MKPTEDPFGDIPYLGSKDTWNWVLKEVCKCGSNNWEKDVIDFGNIFGEKDLVIPVNRCVSCSRTQIMERKEGI